MVRRSQTILLFPYTTLFRSGCAVFGLVVVAQGDRAGSRGRQPPDRSGGTLPGAGEHPGAIRRRSEEHTSELQSLRHLVCRLLLEKKKNVAAIRGFVSIVGKA